MPSYRGEQPRKLTEPDIIGWIDIADKRDTGQPPSHTDREQWIAYLKAKNPVRVWRMKNDMRWAQRVLKRIGVDPEEVRWLL